MGLDKNHRMQEIGRESRARMSIHEDWEAATRNASPKCARYFGGYGTGPPKLAPYFLKEKNCHGGETTTKIHNEW